MEKITSLFNAPYMSLPTSPTMGAVRRSGTSRRLKPAFIVAAILASASLLFLATRNHEYISQHITEPLKHGKILQPLTSDEEKTPTSSESPPPDSLELPPKYVAQIQNSTLGFERVLLINLPARTDKLDAQLLSSSITGFNYTVIDGVRDDDVDPKAYPWDWSDRDSAPPARGCWRAHMNAIQTIVHQGISSALIIEDDSDWDVNLKAQLATLGAATQKLVHQAEKNKEPHSPYGDGWDLLWLGHCASTLRSDTERVLIRNDPTVAPPTKKWDLWEPGYNALGVTRSTRVISKGNNAICTNSYAVTLAGAQKILYHGSFIQNPDAIDQRFNAMCDDKNSEQYPEFECLHVYPSMINGGRKPGRSDGESDQAGHDLKKGEKVKMHKDGFSYNTIWSAKMNMGNSLKGKQPVRQWTDEDMGERDLDESKGVELVYQPAGWAKTVPGVAEEKAAVEAKKKQKAEEEAKKKKQKEEEEAKKKKQKEEEEAKKKEKEMGKKPAA